MVQTRSAKMDERTAKLVENLNVKFNNHKEGMKAFIQNLFAEFKEEMKIFGTIFSAKREDKYTRIGESHASAADNKFKECHLHI